MSLTSTSSRLVRRAGLGLAAVVLMSAASPFVAQAAPQSSSECSVTPNKCYSFSLSSTPASPTMGQAATYTGTLRNLSRGGDGVQLGAVDVTLPSSWYGVTAGSVSPSGSETLSGSTLQLRDLNIAPRRAATFTFTATAPLGGTYAFTSQAKQSNNFSGTGNDLTLSGGDPSVVIASTCTLVADYNSCGDSIIDQLAGGSTSSGELDSNGNPAVVRTTITYAPINVPGSFVSQVYTQLGGLECPGFVGLACDFVASVGNKIPAPYDISRNAVTMTIDCGSLCADDLLPRVWYQLDETTGIQELLPPCNPLSTIVPSPLSGSYACIDGFTVRNITNINDWKVMS